MLGYHTNIACRWGIFVWLAPLHAAPFRQLKQLQERHALHQLRESAERRWLCTLHPAHHINTWAGYHLKPAVLYQSGKAFAPASGAWQP